MRRTSRACSVAYWIGCFDGTTFIRDHEMPVRRDIGSDFDAAIVDTPRAGGDERVLVAWASSWKTTGAQVYPGGAHGGPISLPRLLTLMGGRLHQRPTPAAVPLAAARIEWQPGQAIQASFTGTDGEATISVDADGLFTVSRTGIAPFATRADVPFAAASAITVFNDAGLIEAFSEPAGIAATLYLTDACRTG